MNLAKIFKLLALLRKLRVKELLAFPSDYSDSAACRKWVLAVVDSAGVFSALSGTKVDDEAVSAVRSVIANDVAWDSIHSLFLSVVSDEKPETWCSTPNRFSVSEKEIRGFNPAIIMIIIQAVSLLLRLFRNRR